MALVLADRVQETTTTSGPGTITLAGAVSGFQSFAVIGNTNTTYYTITDGTAWEVGIGTYNSGTLTRDTVFASTNSNNRISLSGGTANVFVTYPADRAVVEDATGNLPIASGGTGATTLADAQKNLGIITIAKGRFIYGG